METPTRADLAQLDRTRKKRGSNDDWTHPHDPDAKITKMKDGRTHLAHKAEHAADLEKGAIVGVTVQDSRTPQLEEEAGGTCRGVPQSAAHSERARTAVAAAARKRLERPFAHLYETGGMRRVHLRGHTNILKRLLIHSGLKT